VPLRNVPLRLEMPLCPNIDACEGSTPLYI
jgi:hypothetical protein